LARGNSRRNAGPAAPQRPVRRRFYAAAAAYTLWLVLLFVLVLIQRGL